MLEHRESELLVKIAREAFERSLKFETPTLPSELPLNLHAKRGVFVRIRRSRDRFWGGQMETLACLGYAFPSQELANAAADSAVACAAHIGMSTSLEGASLQNVLFEVSVLSEPELLDVGKPIEYPKRISLRKDGLIVEYGFANGLILPQIAIENNYDENDLLCECCVRAGLPSSSWLSLSGIKVYKFRAEVFREKESAGDVFEFIP
jgi:uncharacterized protein (TIGR00296 family)